MTSALDKKSTAVHQYHLRILQWNTNGIHGELPHQESLIEATNMDVVCIQEIKLQTKDKTPQLSNFSDDRRD